MSHSFRRALAVAAAAIGVFTLSVVVGLQLAPEPRTQLDYLVIGSVATFLMLGTVFGLLLAVWLKPRNFLARRRPKETGAGGAPRD